MPVEASFFKGANGIYISGTPQFTNNMSDQDSTNSEQDQRRQARAQTVPSLKAEANRLPDQQVRSEPDVHSAPEGNFSRPAPPYTISAPVVPTSTQAAPAPPTISPSPPNASTYLAVPVPQVSSANLNILSTDPSRPAPAHSASAPAVGTVFPSPTNASPYLAVPTPQTQSTNTSSTSLTPSVATSPGISQGSPGLELHRPASAPAPSTLGSSVGSPLTVSSAQQLSVSVAQVDLSARYQYLVTQQETRFEIRRKLVDVAQSLPKDKFFLLKDQATRAISILGLIEGSTEKILSKKEVVWLCLESHAVAFVTIMAAETQPPNNRTIFNLFEILGKVEQLMDNIVHKNGLSMRHPLKKMENEKLVKSYRRELEAWLKDFQNDKGTTIAFALHQASIALSKALYAEQHAMPGSI